MKSVFAGMALAIIGLTAWVAFAKINAEDTFYHDIRPAHLSWNGSDLETIHIVSAALKQTEYAVALAEAELEGQEQEYVQENAGEQEQPNGTIGEACLG